MLKFVGPHRLGEECLAWEVSGIRLRFAGHQENRNMGQRRSAFEACAQFGAARARHIAVRDDQIGKVAKRHRESRLPVLCQKNMVTHPLQRDVKCPEVFIVVVDK